MSGLNNSGRWILAMVLVSLFAIVLMIVYTMSGNESSIDGAAIHARADRTNSVTTGADATHEYVNQLEQYSKQKAQDAAQTGQSYVAPIIKGGEMVTWDEMSLKDDHQVPPPPEPVRPVRNTIDPTPPPVDHSDTLLSLVTLWDHVPHSDTVHKLPDRQTDEETQPVAANTLTANPLTGLINIGDILYASIDFNIDTDFERSGFIVSSVLSGPLRGAQLFGKFSHKRTSQWGESLMIEYDQIVLKSGVVAPIDGIAVDPKYSRTNIAHEVDRHYFYRWGSLFTASLLKGWEGFANATANSGTQSAFGLGLGGGGTLIRATPRYSLKDRALIGSGEMAKELAQVLRENFRRPNTVRVFASHMGGRPVGIVVRSLGSSNRLYRASSEAVDVEDHDSSLKTQQDRSSNRVIPEVPAVSYRFPTPDKADSN